MGTADNNPLVSVIIPVYNTAAYLDACLSSLLQLPYGNFEVIVVDDGSDQETKDALSALPPDSRVKIVHKENGGLSSARNRGLQEVHGEYISYLDSDDYFLGDCFSELIPKMQKTGATLGVFGRESERDAFLCTDFEEEVVDAQTAFNYLVGQRVGNKIRTLYLSAYGKIFHRSVVQNSDGSFIRFNESLTHLEDGNYWTETFGNWGKVYIDPKVFYHVTKRDDSLINADMCVTAHHMLIGYRAMIAVAQRKGYDEIIKDLICDAYHRAARYYVWTLAKNKKQSALVEIFEEFDEELKTEALSVVLNMYYQSNRNADRFWLKMKEFEARLQNRN